MRPQQGWGWRVQEPRSRRSHWELEGAGRTLLWKLRREVTPADPVMPSRWPPGGPGNKLRGYKPPWSGATQMLLLLRVLH